MSYALQPSILHLTRSVLHRCPHRAWHLADFMAAYKFARRLQNLKGFTPYEYICKIWSSEPDRSILNPIHQIPGQNT
jgi:hypothetical protein